MPPIPDRGEVSPSLPDRQLTLSNQPKELAKLTLWTGQLVRALALDEQTAHRVDLALMEAVANVIQHAFPHGGDHPITVTCVRTPGSLRLEVIDDGRLFDPLKVPHSELPTTAEAVPPGGRGIRLFRSLADAVYYERRDNQNRLSLVFDV